jgi:hypothetical protein
MFKGFQEIEQILNKTIDDVIDFLHTNGKYKIDINRLSNDYSIVSNLDFNIFAAFSDYYYRENFHSDILRYIFDPNTKRIGNLKYIETLKKYIETKLDKDIQLDLNTTAIEREKDRIDLLIKDAENNCILIENKANNAPDMEDQLGRYYKKLIEKNYFVKAVIYLTLSPLKKLDKDYSIKDLSTRNAIEKILLEIPIVNKAGESSFVDDVIDKCIDISKNIDISNNMDTMTSTVFLNEYSNLLKYLGGDFVTKELNTQAMYKIFEDRNSLNSFRIFGDLWNKREEIIPIVFKEYLQDQLGFLTHSGDVDNSIYKKVKDDINIGFYFAVKPNAISFGFVHTPDTKQINAAYKSIFLELLENEKIQKYFVENSQEDNPSWITKNIDHNKVDCLDDLKILVEQLEKMINEKI